MPVGKTVKAILKMSFADMKSDIKIYLKPVLFGVAVVGIGYGASYAIDFFKVQMNLGIMNNFALLMIVEMVTLAFVVTKQKEEIKKLKKELDEWA